MPNRDGYLPIEAYASFGNVDVTDTLSLAGIGRIITGETGDRVEITADGNLLLGDGDNVVRLSADDATYRL